MNAGWIFPPAGAAALMIAFLPVSFQAVRATRGTSVGALRHE